MRMSVEVLGIGERKCGISNKNRQKYDFTEVAVAFEHKKFEGRRCDVVCINQDIIEQHTLHVGDVIEAEVFEINYKTRIACIYA